MGSARDADLARRQHICLSRNEDVLLPSGPTVPLSLVEFDRLQGVELIVADASTYDAILVGHNRYANYAPMFGVISIIASKDAIEYPI
jgi:hypothetical protein